MVSIPISGEVEARLRARAAAAGQDVVTYAAKVLERLSQPPRTLGEISGPLAEEFRASGMTDDGLGDLLEEVKHEMRRQRRDGP
jgi:hypothetical protein